MSSAGCEGGEVGSEGAVELSGDEAFEAADEFLFGFALGEPAVHVAAGSFAVAEPDDDDHVQSAVGVAVAREVEPVAACAPWRCGDGRGPTQVGEGCLGAEPVDVLAYGDEQGRGVVGAAAEARQGHRRCDSDQPVEPALEFGGFGAELGDAATEAAQSGLGRIGEESGVWAQPSAHGGFALQGPTGLELLAQSGGGSDEQVAKLAQRSRPGPDGAAGGDVELANRLDDAGGVVGRCGWLTSITAQPAAARDRVKAAP